MNRKEQEMQFHNMREEDRSCMDEESFLKKYSNKKYYAIQRKSTEYIDGLIERSVKGKTVLDYCCGLGAMSLQMAQKGGIVYGIDISDESVKTAEAEAKKAGVADRTNFSVMDAEELQFPDNTFDVILCSGVLHHLDLDNAYPELARVLKPGGLIICGEALGYNPIISLYRKMTPHLRTAWEAEHILTLRDLRKAKKYFGTVKVDYFHLASIAAVPFRNTPIFKPILSTLEAVDDVLLKIPYVQLMAWQMIFTLSDPKVAK
ncbi:class I SAM-dependent methyltransferase [Geomonas oryzisoli]|uniref:Class I SAM-dependent methyltransferase n=1 Tax=Geomonas oryzisoli TaxID=2847992 RepID=A0ABX8J3V2_9BACT|nr:class I SAM-dependent methyltransferase [Geomonas oryzisoli]QWV91952.1 class I SAM-dependent methyltransferase [Geomonas oryzisoli]